MKRLNVYFIFGLMVMMAIPSYGQRYEVTGVRKRASYNNHATIVFNSTAKDLDIVSTRGDSLFYQNYDGIDTWKLHVDLDKERAYGGMGRLQHSFILHTPYMEDSVFVVPGRYMDLNQASYVYRVRVINYFPYRISFELPFLPEWCFGARVSAGRRLGAYFAFKWGMHSKDGMNIDTYPEIMDIGELKYEGKICKSFTAGVKYGLSSRRLPIYGYLGLGYGEAGYSYSNGRKGKERQMYYSQYTRGVQGEMGVSAVFFDFLSVSVGAETVFGSERVAARFCLGLGVCISPND